MLKAINRNRIETIKFLIVLYATTLPWGHALANIVLGLLSMVFLSDFIWDRKWRKNPCKKDLLLLLSFSSLFWLYSIGLFFSENIDEGLKVVVRRLPFLLFPLIILSYRAIISRKTLINSIKGYTISLILVCAGSIIFAYYNCYDHTRAEVIRYCLTDQNLAEALISYHKLYLSLYISIGIFFLLYFFFIEKEVFFYKTLHLLSILFLVFFLFLLGGRTSVAISVILSIAIPVFYWAKHKRYLKVFLYCFLFLSVVIGSLVFNTSFREKAREAINYGNSYNIDKKWGGATVRKLIWKYSFEVVKENPFLGVGSGDTKQELEKSYLKCTESAALKGKNYNTHNDLLQISVAVGLLGLLCFIMSIVYTTWCSIKRKNLIHLLFVIIILASGLTESLTERDMGVRIFAFFTVLLFIFKKNENTPNS